MPSALYYPHTNLLHEGLLKTALLLWDEVETLGSPYGEGHDAVDPRLRPALDLVTVQRYPLDYEQEAVHREIVEMSKSGFIEQLLSQPFQWERGSDYQVYVSKFLGHTWEEIREFIRPDEKHGYHVPAPLALLMMALLANQCAGNQLHKMTNYTDAYTWLEHLKNRIHKAQSESTLMPKEETTAKERLTALAIQIIDASEVPLENLIRMRQRERDSSDYRVQYRTLRAKYHDGIAEYVRRLAIASTPRQKRTVTREFENAMRLDVKALEGELRDATWNTFTRKEVYVSVYSAYNAIMQETPTLASTWTAVVSATATAGLAVRSYLKEREKAYADHPMSWLFLANRKFVP